jgi:hypothetical protein
MAPARPGLVGNTLGSLAIVGVVALIALGLPLFDRSLPAARPLPASVPFAVGGGVSVVPPPAAALDVSQTRPGAARGTALFVVGSIRYAVVAAPFTGTLSEAALRLRGKITGKSGYQVAADARPTVTDAGVPGIAGSYDSPGRLGRYEVFVARGVAVEVTISGPETELRAALPALTTSVRSLTFGPGP